MAPITKQQQSADISLPQAVNQAKASTSVTSTGDAATDLGLVSLEVSGCPGTVTRVTPRVSLESLEPVVVTEYEWALEGAAAPAVVIASPGQQASASFSLKVGAVITCVHCPDVITCVHCQRGQVLLQPCLANHANFSVAAQPSLCWPHSSLAKYSPSLLTRANAGVAESCCHKLRARRRGDAAEPDLE